MTGLLAKFQLHIFFPYLQNHPLCSLLLPLSLQSHPVVKENKTLSLLTFQVKGNRENISFEAVFTRYYEIGVININIISW